MAKTKPVGVRFDDELLEELKKRGVKTAQQALILYEAAYRKEMGGTWAIGAKLVDAAKGRVDVVEKPKISSYTLLDIKAMCPPNLTGIARSTWIYDKKKELGLT